MGHVKTVIDLLKRKTAQSVPAAPASPKVYDLPGLKGFSGPTPEQLIMYKKEFNLHLEDKRKYQGLLSQKPLKKEERQEYKAGLRNAKERLQDYALKIGRLKPSETENGFPEVKSDAK
jgi:hypothetical protein